MKKALGVFLMTAMAFGAFADEPVASSNIAEFKGSASVSWGVDLDSGTTGFKNESDISLKFNFTGGDFADGKSTLKKGTTGDGVWGELVLKAENTPNKDGTISAYKLSIDKAQININKFYIGIKEGDTRTGKLKMDAAIRSADNDNATWVTDKGPGKDEDEYKYGITLGYDEPDLFKVDLDLRSRPAEKTVYTDNYAAALEGEFKGVENLSIKAGVSYNFAKNAWDQEVKHNEGSGTPKVKVDNGQGADHILGYSASVGYKFPLSDTMFVRPQVGFGGQSSFTSSTNAADKVTKTTGSSAEMAFGLLLGWGDIGQNKNADVYYLDGDSAKKVTPGVGVVAHIPFVSTGKRVYDGETQGITKTYNAVAARIMPSFYSGEIIPGLTAAAYADIVIPKTGEDKIEDKTKTEFKGGKDRATAMAFTLGAKYAIPVDELTITPQAGLRFANAAYVAYGKATGDSQLTEKGTGVFTDMGEQKKLTGEDKEQVVYDGNFMNLKLGVEVAGLVDNTTFSVVWSTRNILNATDYPDKTVGPKAGTLDFTAKIAL